MTGCKGCGVGPDDECEEGCPATVLWQAGWTHDEIDLLLAGPGASAELFVPKVTGEALLTAEEHALMSSLAVLHNRFALWIDPTRSALAENDFREVVAHLHDLQARVLSAAAMRAFPDRYRIIGGRS